MLVFFIAFVLAAIHFGLSSTTMKPWYDMGRAANVSSPTVSHSSTDSGQYFIYGQIFYVFGVGMEKLSIGLVLLRLTSNVLMLRTTRIIIIVAMSVMCATAIAIGVVVAKQCRPVDDATRVQTDNCLDSKSVGTAAIVLAAIDMTVNCLFAVCLPSYRVSQQRSCKPGFAGVDAQGLWTAHGGQGLNPLLAWSWDGVSASYVLRNELFTRTKELRRYNRSLQVHCRLSTSSQCPGSCCSIDRRDNPNLSNIVSVGTGTSMSC